MSSILISRYAQLPQLDAHASVAMATGLMASMPKNTGPAIKKAAKKMGLSLAALKAILAGEPLPEEDKSRAADLGLDRAWGSLSARIASYAALPVEFYPKAARASELMRVLFPDGLSFLKLPYRQEWAESEKRLERVERMDLEDSIREIAGREHLEQLRRAHRIYGEVLGITKPNAVPQAPERAEKLRELRQSMSHYVLNVLASLDEDEPESEEMVRRSLQPVDEFRAAAAARRSTYDEAGEEPEAPSVVSPGPIVSPGPVASSGPAEVAGGGAPIARTPTPIPVRPAPSNNPS